MRIYIECKDGQMEFEGTPTEEERRLYGELKTAAEMLRETARDFLEYKKGQMEFEGTPTEEERALCDDLKTATGMFYKTVKDLLGEGVLEIKVKKEGD